jgi:hypothetical protein
MVLSDLIRGFADLIETARERLNIEQQTREEQAANQLVKLLEEGEIDFADPEDGTIQTTEPGEAVDDPGDAIAGIVGTLPEELENVLTDRLDPENVRDLDEVRGAVDQAEGAAFGLVVGGYGGGLALEAASAGQIDTQQEYVAQALSFLALDDILGQELEVELSEGVRPSLNAAVNEEFRTKFVDLQDVVERDLRNKDADEDYIEDIATYGIRESDVPILEEVALNAMEFEELIETPAELGLVVPDEVLDAELDRAGYSEDTKDFLRQVNGRIRESARIYQELIETEELVTDLDTLVEDGIVGPEEAAAQVTDRVDADLQALQSRFRQKRSQPAGAPSQADHRDAFVRGYITREEFETRVDQQEFPVDEFGGVVDAIILDELDGALQESLALGLVSESEFTTLAGQVGLDDETARLLTQGNSFSDIVDARLAQGGTQAQKPTSVLVGIGEARAGGLSAQGIETLTDLAQASVATVADGAQVSDDRAAEFIQQARARVR